MGIFNRLNLKKQLTNYMKSGSSNIFLNTLNNINEKDLINIFKDKTLLDYFNKISINHDKYLYADFATNEYEIEKIESILVKNKLKDISECNNKNIELWKEYLKDNPNEIIKYSGELDDELRKIVYPIIDNNPNVMLNSNITDDVVISYAYSKYDLEVPMSKSYKEEKIQDEELLKNKYYLKQFLQDNQQSLMNNKDFNDFLTKDYDINNKNFEEYLNKWDYILSDNSISDEFIKNIFSEEKYETIFKNYFESPVFFKSKLFNVLAKNYHYDGPIFIDQNLSNSELAHIITNLYKTNKEMVEHIPSSTFGEYSENKYANFNTTGGNYWKELFEKMNYFQDINQILGTNFNSSDKRTDITILFLKNMGYKITKENIITAPQLIKYSDEVILTKEDFINNQSLRNSKEIIIESLKKGTDVSVLDYVDPTNFNSLEVLNLAKEKGYKFTSKNINRFNYTNIDLLKAVIDNNDFDFLNSNLISKEAYQYAIEKGFKVDYQELFDSKQYFRYNETIMMDIIKNQNKDAIYLFRNDSKEQNNVECFNEILKDENLRNKYTINEINYFKAVTKSPELLNNIRFFVNTDNNGNKIIDKSSINKYFNETGPTKDFFRFLYDNKDFNSISLLKDNNYSEAFTPLEQRILLEYEKLNYDKRLQEEYKKIIINNEEMIKNQPDFNEKFDVLINLLKKISTSNSMEIQNLKVEILNEIIKTSNPLENYQKIEDIFIKNNIPTVGKEFLCFNILHPNLNSYNFGDKSYGSNVCCPSLRAKKNRGREITIFSDLIKNSLGTNNREMISYINNLELGNKLYLDLKNNKVSYNNLSDKDKNILIEFRNHLKVLYSNTKNGEYIKDSGNVITDIDYLASIYPDASKNANTLADKVVSSFGHFAGFDTIAEIKNYMNQKLEVAEANNRARANTHDFTIEKGDFVKGFEIAYLESMLQNGINACDFLGANQKTDATALDTDLSRINNPKDSISSTIDAKNGELGSYGNGYIVLKNDPKKIAVTKVRNSEEYNVEDINNINVRLEAFYTAGESGVTTSYGIRTGFSASDIDYLILDEKYGKSDLNKMKMSVVLNGLYIPIISKTTNELLFSPEEYDKLREKMNGLSYYNKKDYKISDNLSIENINSIKENIDGNKEYIDDIKSKILYKLGTKLNGLGLNVTTNFTKNLDYKTVQIIDTGSTSRYTNTPYDCDFDLMLRIDREIYNNEEKMNEFRNAILDTFGSNNYSNVNGDLKELKVNIDGKIVPLDISFVQKTDKMSYSSEMCVQDRLSTIKEQYPDKYKDVLSNIIFAKSYLKEHEVYKKGIKQGGLGGLGVENWILENGGSFYDASIEFLNAARKENGELKTYSEFVDSYEIWDFGQNYYTDKKNSELTNKASSYMLYDNFVRTNLTSEGYDKMIVALNEYVNNIKYQDTLDTISNKL